MPHSLRQGEGLAVLKASEQLAGSRETQISAARL